jgi:hypothetical protein
MYQHCNLEFSARAYKLYWTEAKNKNNALLEITTRSRTDLHEAKAFFKYSFNVIHYIQGGSIKRSLGTASSWVFVKRELIWI